MRTVYLRLKGEKTMQIAISDLTFKYKKQFALILDNVSFKFESGKLYALRGANGSGKTTLGKLILGLLKPTSGDITIDGISGKKLSAGKRADSIGYLFQNPDLQLFATSVIEELTFPYELTNRLTDEKKEQLTKLLTTFKLDGMENRFPLTMSGGEKQRLALATVMSRNVKFLILDEPTSAIDSDGLTFIINFVNDFVRSGGGAILITHDEDFLEALESPVTITLKGGNLF